MPDLPALIPLAEAHAEHDELVTGDYGHEDPTTPGGFIGCSIGCTIYDAQRLGLLPADIDRDDHQAVADLLYDGYEWVARVQDDLYESLPDAERTQWTPRLLRAVIGYEIDWQRIWHRWAGALMTRLVGVQDPGGVVSRVAKLHQRALSERVPTWEWATARDAARNAVSAAWAADAAAVSAAWAADAAAVAAAWDADWAAWDAAVAAVAAARDADAAWNAAVAAAWAAEATRQADDLIAAIEHERTPAPSASS